jgi:hypothetical protein
MEWLENTLSQDALILFLSITVMVGFFMLAAYRVRVNHVKRIKKIDQTFNLTNKYTR